MWILEGVLSPQQLENVRKEISNSEFVDGKLTAGGPARKVKNNLQLKRPTNQPVRIDGLLLDAFSRHPLFNAVAMPRAMSVPMICRYDPGMSYGPHVDSAQMGGNPPMRTDLSVTLFISDPDEYDGGELMIETAFGDQPIKLPAGNAFCYPTNAMHRVTEVTRGSRLVAIFWVQSAIHDNELRQSLFELNCVYEALEETAPEATHTRLLHKTINNLTRKLSD